MSHELDIKSPKPPGFLRESFVQIGQLLGDRRRSLGALAIVSVLGGFTEALFLVVATRSAFAVTSHSQRVTLVGLHSTSRDVAVVVGLGLVLLRTGLAVLSARLSAELSASVTADVRKRLAAAFLGATWSAQESSRAGRLQELLTTFALRGSELINSVAGFVVALFNLVAMLGLAIVVDPSASVLVVAAVLALASLLRPMRAALRRQASRAATTGMSFATSLHEVAQLGQEMHTFGVQSETRQRVFAAIEVDAEASARLSFLRGLLPAVYTSLAYLALSISVGLVSMLGVSDVAAIGSVLLVMMRSLGYGQSLQSNSASVNSALPFVAVLEAELNFFEGRRLVDGGRPVGRVGSIAFRQVDFDYSAASPVLRDVNFTIEPGEAIGIIGPSGSGKSTIVRLILGLYQPTQGQVESDGRCVTALSRSDWARKVTLVPQQGRFISGTVRENIRFLRAGVSDAEIIHAAALAHLHDEILTWPEGYERQVGNQGGNLSGGQQQRLIIARALVEQPEVMVLDEPTSALDVRSEALVLESLRQLRTRMTVIIIAHRLSTLDVCDRLMVVQQGRVVAFDSPSSLKASSGYYADSLALAGIVQ